MARRPVTVLLYHPDEAERYAALVHAPRGVTLRVTRTVDEATWHVADADVIYGWQFPPDLYPSARRLRWIQATGAGVEWALVPELPPQVAVTRAPGVFGPWMAEYVIGWCAWVTQRVETYRQAQRERRWIAHVLPDRLRGKTLVVVGLGDVGREIARVAKAFGMRVVGVSRRGRQVRGVDEVHGATELRTALTEGDWVVIVLPLTPETRGIIGAAELEAMRPTAWLMSLGRGPVVDETALVRALEDKRIAGAILDVFTAEPLPADHPLWGFDNVVVTPHISGPSTPAEIAPIFEDNLRRFLADQPLRHVVDRRRGY